MGFKNSPGCGCCGETGPCCVAAKRYFMDREGFTAIQLSSGPAGGPFDTLRSYFGSCGGGTGDQSAVQFPAFNMAGPYTTNLARNDDRCLFRNGQSLCPSASASRFDMWDNGGTLACLPGTIRSYIALGSDALSGGTCPVSDGNATTPIFFGGRINFYCDGGNYAYELEVTTGWSLRSVRQYDPASDFTLVSGGTYTTTYQSDVFGRWAITYVRNDNNASITVNYDPFSPGNALIATTRSFNPDTSVTQWAPGLDYSGISEAGTLSLV